MNPGQPLDISAVLEARSRIAPHVIRTPLRLVAPGHLWLKCENRQRTGSFKLRGALNKILGLESEALGKGVVAASAGNHGLGVVFAARVRGVEATVFVPEYAVPRKVAGIEAMGGRVNRVRGDYAAAERAGLAYASESGAAWISPYNDHAVIAGQGTIGLELMEDLDLGRGRACSVYVPAGGGGLLAGVGLALKSAFPAIRVIGVQPRASPYLEVHFRGGDMTRVLEGPTRAEGLAGAVEPGSITLDMIREVADDFVLVEETEIEEAIAWVSQQLDEVVEPSGAAALAACLKHAGSEDKVVILSGGNIDPVLFHRLTGRRDATADESQNPSPFP